jgi:acylglycerol lipase
MLHGTGSFSGLNNTTIFTQRWFPDAMPRAVVLLAHGYGEHSGRYAHVAARLVAGGYAVCALDHRGHGRSEGPRVQVDRFEDFVADFVTYYQQVRAEFPDLPMIVYGHSMGSLIGLLFAFDHQGDLAGLITSGTALKIVGVNLLTAPVLEMVSHVIPAVRLVPLGVAGISRDPAVIERYKSDPLVAVGLLRTHMVAELVRAGEECIRRLPTLHLPYLALHGSADPIVHPGSVDVIRARCGSDDLTLKVYEGLYHEVHNEPEQAAVLDDVVSWLDAVVSKC